MEVRSAFGLKFALSGCILRGVGRQAGCGQADAAWGAKHGAVTAAGDVTRGHRGIGAWRGALTG